MNMDTKKLNQLLDLSIQRLMQLQELTLESKRHGMKLTISAGEKEFVTDAAESAAVILALTETMTKFLP